MAKIKQKSGVNEPSSSDLHASAEIDALLASALREDISTEERFRQLEHVLESSRKFGLAEKDPARDLQLLLALGLTYRKYRHNEKAYESLTQALQIAQNLNDQRSSIQLHREIGKIYTAWGHWENALHHCRESWRISQMLKDDYGSARALICQGEVYFYQGRMEQAGKDYTQACNIGGNLHNYTIVLDALNSLAVIDTVQGKLDEAVTHYQFCLNLCQLLKDNGRAARILQNLGMSYADMHKWNPALECYERGLAIAQEQGLLEVVAGIYHARAEMMIEWGDASMASSLCSRALDVFQKTGHHLGEADTYRLLGCAYSLKRQWASAMSMFQKSIDMNTRHNIPLNLAEAYRDLGKMHMARNQTREARTALEKALSGFENLNANRDVAQVEELLKGLDPS